MDNRIEEVKKILAQYTLDTREKAFNARATEVAKRICQLFPQPLDEVCPECGGDGRIYKCLDRCFSNRCPKCNGYGKMPQPLDDKKLREKIAKFLYDNFNTTSKGSWIQLPELNEVRQWWLMKADQILALLQPKIEEANCLQKEPVTDKIFNAEDVKTAIEGAGVQERERILTAIKETIPVSKEQVIYQKYIFENIGQALKGGE